MQRSERVDFGLPQPLHLLVLATLISAVAVARREHIPERVLVVLSLRQGVPSHQQRARIGEEYLPHRRFPLTRFVPPDPRVEREREVRNKVGHRGGLLVILVILVILAMLLVRHRLWILFAPARAVFFP